MTTENRATASVPDPALSSASAPAPATAKRTKTPTLLVVMGTSGCGKSTVGAALSSALSCPFVDGDDLHPVSNIDKMSRGQPLNDADREPWLKIIRNKALELTRLPQQQQQQQQTQNQDAHEGNKDVRKLAEVWETSQQPPSDVDVAREGVDSKPSNLSSSAVRPSAPALAPASAPAPCDSDTASSSPRIAVIACSSLKRSYRQLLRGTITSLPTSSSSSSSSAPLKRDSVDDLPQDLTVVHIYLHLSQELLEKRMEVRKGHFMKPDMLRSQLATLEPPSPETEPNVIRIDVLPTSSTEHIVAQIRSYLLHAGLA
ncbi:carbohydrate kinase [Testicularia cyperi]|uniref:gluconokinase n=1 Tax=Testicularia cyperi TaxID=1882483 RepID=A0A317XEL6_9BASI|nr:carbohydrate kinase [Testicularia cyperi]